MQMPKPDVHWDWNSSCFSESGENQKERDGDKEKMKLPGQDPRRAANFSAAALRKWELQLFSTRMRDKSAAPGPNPTWLLGLQNSGEEHMG